MEIPKLSIILYFAQNFNLSAQCNSKSGALRRKYILLDLRVEVLPVLTAWKELVIWLLSGFKPVYIRVNSYLGFPPRIPSLISWRMQGLLLYCQLYTLNTRTVSSREKRVCSGYMTDKENQLTKIGKLQGVSKNMGIKRRLENCHLFLKGDKWQRVYLPKGWKGYELLKMWSAFFLSSRLKEN